MAGDILSIAKNLRPTLIYINMDTKLGHVSIGSAPSIRGGMILSDEYARGRRDGLRLALAMLAAEEAKWEALLGESRSRRTNATREVRHKTLKVAQSRVQTVLNRLTSKSERSMDAELALALEKAWL